MTGIVPYRMLAAGLCICSSAALLHGDVVAETIQNLRLSFTSSAGSVMFLGSNDATTFGAVSDSFGGMGQQTMDGGNGPATISVSTPVVLVNFFSVGGATAIASADAQTLTSDNLATAELFKVAGSASARATSTLTGSFEIVGTGSPATLNVSAALQVVDNFAETDAAGLAGSSEALVSVTLSNGDIPINFDNLVSVGPDQQNGFTRNQMLTGSSILQPDTPYTFTALEASYANATNSAALPEPSYLLLSVILLSGLIAHRQLRSRV